ncbi:hypothetical protein ACFY05_32040 [Microtetraspora fusca]|uniref:Uncharacterized protein n=1 Tax=Microtetraspora fusca TaxID=1997 RepID=A0ABW6VFZ7_MICFU
MNQQQAKRAAYLYVARLVEAQSNEDAMANFLQLPEWVGEDRHPDVYALERAVHDLVIKLRSQARGRRPAT